MYTGRLEKLPVAHDGNLCVIHAQSYALVSEMFTVQKQRKITDVVMLKFVPVAVQRTDKICNLYHGEQQIFHHGTQDGVVHRYLL